VTTEDAHAHGPAALAAGALGEDERRAFEAHASGCDECRRAAAELREVASATLGRAHELPPAARARDHVLALADAPRGEIDPAKYEWAELGPGIRAHEIRHDTVRGIRTVLIWADAGAVNDRHVHLGDEDILILKGALRDERGVYRAGEICRSRRGEIHSETITTDGECFCLAVYYGGGTEAV
jgi:anti-sigma factor ChrR (cupin superfamily)